MGMIKKKDKLLLDFIKGPLEGKTFSINEDDLYLGRDERCDIILNDDDVSREHAQIYWHHGKLTIKDLGSTNGVEVNGHILDDSYVLKEGDRIRICSSDFILRVAPTAIEQAVEKGPGFQLIFVLILSFLGLVSYMLINHLNHEPEKGKETFLLKTIPEKVQVIENGKLIGETPLELELDGEGKYQLILNKLGFQQKVLQFKDFKEIKGPIKLQRSNVQKNNIVVEAYPVGVKIFINNKEYGVSKINPLTNKPELKVANLEYDVEYQLKAVFGQMETNKYFKLPGDKVEVVVWSPDRIIELKTGDKILAIVKEIDKEFCHCFVAVDKERMIKNSEIKLIRKLKPLDWKVD